MKRILSLCLPALIAASLSAQRTDTMLRNWHFALGGDSTKWQNVRVPHDWAITGPFDVNNDLQVIAVAQNGETEATAKTGRTGGLPFVGKGIYRTRFEVADTAGRNVTLLFDGAMSHARVSVNGREAGYWPNGYNSFAVDATGLVRPGSNTVQVELENRPESSRWYPGAGLYRNVHVVNTSRIHVPVWGAYVTTPVVDADKASVHLELEIEGVKKGEKITVGNRVISPTGAVVAEMSRPYAGHGQTYAANFAVMNPQLWSPEHPELYTLETTLTKNDSIVDRYITRFGIRKLEYVPDRGLVLNGVPTKFRGVCNHHDLGPLGAAVNRSALRHQIEMLKDMGVNAIRTSHNMPAPELVELCDEMGMMLMVEAFDDWSFRPKSPQGYGTDHAQWWERDLTNMVKHYRNNPSVVMWSVGNEVPAQWWENGVEMLTMQRDKVRSLDPTRPVTVGMDQIGAVLDNGFAAACDIPGFNYKPQYYERAYSVLPQRMILGSETASTVSSRGVYHFPVDFSRVHNTVIHSDHQSSSYDNETCDWSNTPDIDLFMDSVPWVLGQFVWTGFDYLGEPSPYDTNAWPSHSSLYGIIDLASLPKDRYWLYRSVWNPADTTLHVLPHWTWPGREGQTTPVFVYTNFPSAELFVNGKSQGIRTKNDSTMQTRFRLMWPDVVYEPGELRVVAYDADGRAVAERTVSTAGKPYSLKITPQMRELKADGDDLAYYTVTVIDKQGNIVPADSRRVKFKVTGAGTFEATANGDPTCLLPFQQPEMDLFSGAATAIVRAADKPGTVTITVSAPGVRSASATLPVR